MKIGCDCISEPPIFDLPPPPDPSLVWHLITDKEQFEPAEQCSSNQFVSISDIGNVLTGHGATTSNEEVLESVLIGAAIASILLLVCICAVVIGRIRRRRREAEVNSKKHNDTILVSGEHLWTYNSMKPSLMYTNNSNAGSRLFHHTPTTMRSYIGGGTPIMAPNIPIRNSESTILRLNKNDSCSAYHTVSHHQGIPPSEVYEEIAPIGTIGHVGYMTTTKNGGGAGRMSMRRPPPTCRPPQPPQQSPEPSGGESPRQFEEDGGRESGYGTAPSLQWKSPNGSGSGRLETTNSPYAMPPSPQTMTYV